MTLEIKAATIEQKPIIENLVELLKYDLTEFWDLDLGDDGYFGYERLASYWQDSNRYPFLIYYQQQIIGFALLTKGSAKTEETEVWDMAEFFILKRYRSKGLGMQAAVKLWDQFKGKWQIRVLTENVPASAFWLNTIKTYTNDTYECVDKNINKDNWKIYRFESVESE